MELRFLIIISSLILSVRTQSSEEAETEPDRDICGGVHTESRGSISYKLHKLYNKNERCVWIIRKQVTNVGLRITLTDSDFADRGDYLEVYGEHNHNISQAGIIAPKVPGVGIGTGGSYLRNPHDWVTLSPPSAIAYIVFRSNNDYAGTGFRLVFEQVATGGGNEDETAEIVDYKGEHFYRQEVRGVLEYYPKQFEEDAYYSWTINPNSGQSQMFIHWVHVCGTLLKVFRLSPQNATLLGQFRNVSPMSRITFHLDSRDPIVIFLYNNRSYLGPDLGLQVYWNYQDTPELEHKNYTSILCIPSDYHPGGANFVPLLSVLTLLFTVASLFAIS